MAKLIAVVWLCFFYGVASGQSFTMDEVRELFFQAGRDPLVSVKLFNLLSSNKIYSPLISAYKGVSNAMQAQNSINVYKKYKYFQSGRDTLEIAIMKDHENFEIRFLRFQFQSNIPSFLGYNNLKEDKVFLLSHIGNFSSSSKSPLFSNKIIGILSTSKYLTSREQVEVKQFKTGNN